MRLQFISGNNKLFLKIIFGAKGSEVELFWGGFEFIVLVLYCNKLYLQIYYDEFAIIKIKYVHASSIQDKIKRSFRGIF